MFLVVDHLSPRVDVPDTHTSFIVAGGQVVLVVRIEEHRAGIKFNKLLMKTNRQRSSPQLCLTGHLANREVSVESGGSFQQVSKAVDLNDDKGKMVYH